MANYNEIRAEIDTNVYANGQNLITGDIMNAVLKDIVSALGEGYQFKGIAIPTTVPVSTDAKVFYIAGTPGTYSNFGSSFVLAQGQIGVLYYDSSWHLGTMNVSGGGGGIPEAPEDGKTYGRKDGDWEEIESSGGGIPEAPEDGKTYGRKDGDWEEVQEKLIEGIGISIASDGKTISATGGGMSAVKVVVKWDDVTSKYVVDESAMDVTVAQIIATATPETRFDVVMEFENHTDALRDIKTTVAAEDIFIDAIHYISATEYTIMHIELLIEEGEAASLVTEEVGRGGGGGGDVVIIPIIESEDGYEVDVDNLPKSIEDIINDHTPETRYVLSLYDNLIAVNVVSKGETDLVLETAITESPSGAIFNYNLFITLDATEEPTSEVEFYESAAGEGLVVTFTEVEGEIEADHDYYEIRDALNQGRLVIGKLGSVILHPHAISRTLSYEYIYFKASVLENNTISQKFIEIRSNGNIILEEDEVEIQEKLIAGTGISIAADGKTISATGGGGDSVLLVTFDLNGSENWVVDKTFAEIKAAFDAGRPILGQIPGQGFLQLQMVSSSLMIFTQQGIGTYRVVAIVFAIHSDDTLEYSSIDEDLQQRLTPGTGINIAADGKTISTPALLPTAQTLTDAQKAQVLTNLGLATENWTITYDDDTTETITIVKKI